MANTGHTWSAWAFVKDGAGGDWDADALADNAILTSNTAISLSGKSSCIVAVFLTEDNTGAINGNVTVAILGDCDAAYEDPLVTGTQVGSPWAFEILPVQNDTVYKPFSVDPTSYDNFKVCVMNESGQELAVSVKYKTADIPVAS